MRYEEFVLSDILASIQKELEYARNELKECPEGTLSEQRRENRSYLIQTICTDEGRKRFGVSKKPEIVSGLIRRALLESEIESLKTNLGLLEEMVSAWKPFDREEWIRALRQRFPAITDEMLLDAFKDPQADEWAKAPYQQSDYRPEAKRHVTSRGLRVRSKSEVLIAEKLYEYHIPFRYEQELIVEGVTLIPDFTIKRSDGKIFIWEHEGLTNVKKYLEWQLKKQQLYASAGIVLWDNLIVSYDNADGNIDLRIVESEIRNRLL